MPVSTRSLSPFIRRSSPEEDEVVVEATLVTRVPPEDASEDALEQKSDKFVIDYLRQHGLPDYEWARPVSFTGNLRRIVTPDDISRAKVTYVGGGGLFDMPLEKQAKLVIARLHRIGNAPPLAYGPRPNFKTVDELIERIEHYDQRANSIVRNVLGTCRAILVWYEHYYQPSE